MPNSFDTIANICRTRFDTLIATPQSLATAYDNQDFDPPNTLWVRFTVQIGNSFHAENAGDFGNFRTIGVCIVSIFEPQLDGEKTALRLVDTIVPIFTRLTDSGVRFRTPSVQQFARQGVWWQTNVVCPFSSDEIA